MANLKELKKKVYTCGVNWQHEVGECKVDMHDSVKSLKRDRQCWKQCGIVELEIKLIKWVTPQKPFRSSK